MFLPPLSHTFISTYLPVERKMQTMRLTSLENCNFNPPTRKEQDACEFWAENAAGISIHLPIKSKTAPSLGPFPNLNISIHLPVKARLRRITGYLVGTVISIHLPVKARLRRITGYLVGTVISIHLPVKSKTLPLTHGRK